MRPETGQAIPAALDQEWSHSAFIEVVSDTGVSSIQQRVYEVNADGSTTLNTMIALDPTKYKQALGQYRPVVSRTFTGSATTAVWGQLMFNFAVNAPLDLDVLIGMPQIERGSIASAPIATTNAAVTVAADYAVNAATGVATFRAALGVAPTCIHYFLTGRVRVTLPVSSDNGLGLTEIAKAFRSTLPARLMLEFKLGTQFDTSGATGLQIANGAVGIMPFTATGTLQL